EESTLFKSINEGYRDEYVEVYAPVPVDRDERAERRRLVAKLEEPIRELLLDRCRAAMGEGEER
ncbi:MAG: hypothetical protein WBE26_19825, partial [Phycisphaerae bacterium]